MADTDLASASDADLLKAFLEGNPDARDKLPRRYHDTLLSMARRRAAYAAPSLRGLDAIEEIAQRVWELLLRRPPGHFDPNRQTPEEYFATLIRIATRDVRAIYPRPGQPTRSRGAKRNVVVRSWPTLFVKEDQRGQAPAADPIGAAADPTDDYALILNKIVAIQLIELAVETAPPGVAVALAYIYEDDMGITAAAPAAGLSRFTLRRYLDAWADQNVPLDVR
jgi:hypothetical protein